MRALVAVWSRCLDEQVGGPGAQAYLATSCRALLLQVAAEHSSLNTSLIKELCGPVPPWLMSTVNMSLQQHTDQCRQMGRLTTAWLQQLPLGQPSLPQQAVAAFVAGLIRVKELRWNDCALSPGQNCDASSDTVPPVDQTGTQLAALLRYFALAPIEQGFGLPEHHETAWFSGPKAPVQDESCTGSERAVAQCFHNQLSFRSQAASQFLGDAAAQNAMDTIMAGCDLDALVVGCASPATQLFGYACNSVTNTGHYPCHVHTPTRPPPPLKLPREVAVIETISADIAGPVQWSMWRPQQI